MLSGVSRVLAMLCSVLALACLGAWLYLGAKFPPGWDADPVLPDNTSYVYSIEIWTDRAEVPGTLERLKSMGYPATVVTSGYEHYEHTMLLVDREFSYKELHAVLLQLRPILGRHMAFPAPKEWEDTLFYMRPGRDGASRALVFDVAQLSRSGARIMVGILAASVLAAACLALLMLVRSKRSPFILDLGRGLGLWSLSFSYLWIFSALPSFDRLRPDALGWGMFVDGVALLLLVAANRAFRRFWDAFPRPVSTQELDGFLESLSREQYSNFGPLRKLWSAVSGRLARSEGGVSGLKLGDRVTLLGCLTVLLVIWLSVLWRVSLMDADRMHTYFDISGPWSVLVLVAYILILYWPGIHCLRLFKFHRMLGSPEERRKIEWIQAALWMGFVAFIVPAAGLAVLYVVSRFFPGLDFALTWCTLYLVIGVFSGPLLMLIAVALSTLYRGNLDPQLALRGFTVWTILGVVLTLGFVLIERSVALRLVQLMKLPPQSGYVATGAMVAATFQPVRRYTEKRVSRFVERVLPESLLATGKRMTGAVAVADISAYTALSAQDEHSALLASAMVQKEAKRLADKHDGRVVKSTGDGVILVFQDAADGLEALRELHEAVSTRAHALELPELRLHSGLHWGDFVEMHDGDIYGQTVNLTARIADWAKAGEIGISETFAMALPGPAAGFEPQGPQRFKNVPQPVVCLKRVLA